MFTSLKSLIDQRLGSGVITHELSTDFGYFIFIHQKHLYHVLFFLKNDPDLKLTLLDQIIGLPEKHPISDMTKDNIDTYFTILYQLKSLNLPYRVTVVIQFDRAQDTLPGISDIFAGARWQEEDLAKSFEITFLESYRE
ncbi:MAG TPA: NADH-quinone oxidoreductase subunit C [Myxococcota bacterium]|nr:NADH-quinone oxidoreductase subunit C [Myxococcota bacterium]